MENATYSKLKDGTWGLRIEGTVEVGDIALAFRKGDRYGTRKLITDIVWTGQGVTLCRFDNAPKAPKKAVETPSTYGMSNAEATDGEYTSLDVF